MPRTAPAALPPPSLHTRIVAMTRNGRFVAFRHGDALRIVDVLGPNPARDVAIAPGSALAWLGDELWATDPDDGLHRISALHHDAAPERVSWPEGRVTWLEPAGDAMLVTTSGGTHLARGAAAQRSEVDGAPGTRVLTGSGHRLVEARRGAVTLRTLGRQDGVYLPVGEGELALAARVVLAQRAVAIWTRGKAGDAIVVATTAGKVIHRIALPPAAACTFAEDANLAIAATDAGLVVVDLRYGLVRSTCVTEAVHGLDTDRQARHVVVTTGSDEVSWFSFEQLFEGRGACVVSMGEGDGSEGREEAPDDGEPTEPSRAVEGRFAEGTAPHAAIRATPSLAVDGLPSLADVETVNAADAGGPDDPHDAPPPLALAPELAPLALHPVPAGVLAYRDADAHLAAMLDVVAARTALVIAESWHSGRASHDRDTDLPCEREVLGLLGEDVGLAADALRHARTRLLERAIELAERTNASLTEGMTLPFHEVAREWDLSPTATQILACAAAPKLRGSIARLYGILAGVRGRSACTEMLLDALVEAEPGCDLGHAIAVELAPDAPLVRAGLVRLVSHPDRTEVVVDAVLVDRLRGVARTVDISDVTTRRESDRTLAQLLVPPPAKESLLLGLADRDPRRPARILLRGRRGAGRNSLVAALAAQVGRSIACIDATQLPRGAGFGAALALELVRADLAGCVPVVAGLEAVANDRTDVDLRLQIQTVLRRHPGPLAVRTSIDGDVPMDPDRIEVELPALSLGDRASSWRTALAARNLAALDDDALALVAARFRFGPGTIERVADQVARRAVRRTTTPTLALVDEVARQHIAGRLERVATRITRLADWDQVTLVDDMLDSVRALIGRVRHQRTVYEDWGYDRRIATARGLTALFYGPPGTGKTLVAGLIGRELGLDVWRVDLARVTSKWLGETEKALAEVFEAAEEGQVLLLFDEADSLFGKRSEVQNSNDRYANLEVNYLLQRLDTFEGVAILTTNLEGSIDPAFKRRLSMRLYFPFPDEELRADLWAAHVPPSVPCAGTLDFADLARRYPLSGGYIRNSALRAAFLAAQERKPLSQDHLIRAVQLEYRELGKLSSSGRME